MHGSSCTPTQLCCTFGKKWTFFKISHEIPILDKVAKCRTKNRQILTRRIGLRKFFISALTATMMLSKVSPVPSRNFASFLKFFQFVARKSKCFDWGTEKVFDIFICRYGDGWYGPSCTPTVLLRFDTKFVARNSYFGRGRKMSNIKALKTETE